MSTKNLTPLSPEFVKMLAQLGYVAVPKKAEIETETTKEEEINVDELLADLNDSSCTHPNLKFKYVN